jgi:hypothetical protein
MQLIKNMQMSIHFAQNRKIVYAFFLVILLAPTIFIHTANYPDWGDDFAQYVYQSQQINSPSSEYKLVLNVDEYSSPKRSVFFSIALSLINPTIEISNYINLISVLYILGAVCVFLFFTNYFTFSISFFGTLCVFYNFLFLRLKSEVVPEFLFISLFYLILYLLYQPKKKYHYFLIPFLIGLLVSGRFIGLSLLLTYFVFLFLQPSKTNKQKLVDLLICSFVFIGVVVFINLVFLSEIKNDEVGLYGGAVLDNYSLNTLFENVSIYLKYSLLFFEQEIPFWMNGIIKVSMSIAFLIGFITSLKNLRNFANYALAFYLLFIFIYPYNGDTIKYLIPVFPLIIFYIVVGINNVLDNFRFSYKTQLVAVILSGILVSNSKTIFLAITQNSNNIGPYNASVIKDFFEIKQVVKSNESIAFAKPFVINLLADRNSYFMNEKNHKELLGKAHYFLIPKSTINELYFKSKNIVALNADTIELKNFYLLKLNSRNYK